MRAVLPGRSAGAWDRRGCPNRSSSLGAKLVFAFGRHRHQRLRSCCRDRLLTQFLVLCTSGLRFTRCCRRRKAARAARRLRIGTKVKSATRRSTPRIRRPGPTRRVLIRGARNPNSRLGYRNAPPRSASTSTFNLTNSISTQMDALIAKLALHRRHCLERSQDHSFVEPGYERGGDTQYMLGLPFYRPNPIDAENPEVRNSPMRFLESRPTGSLVRRQRSAPQLGLSSSDEQDRRRERTRRCGDQRVHRFIAVKTCCSIGWIRGPLVQPLTYAVCAHVRDRRPGKQHPLMTRRSGLSNQHDGERWITDPSLVGTRSHKMSSTQSRTCAAWWSEIRKSMGRTDRLGEFQISPSDVH
jgi:hypothetical protein